MKASPAEESLSIIAGIVDKELESGLFWFSIPACQGRPANRQEGTHRETGGNNIKCYDYNVSWDPKGLRGREGHARETFVATGSKSW